MLSSGFAKIGNKAILFHFWIWYDYIQSGHNISFTTIWLWDYYVRNRSRLRPIVAKLFKILRKMYWQTAKEEKQKKWIESINLYVTILHKCLLYRKWQTNRLNKLHTGYSMLNGIFSKISALYLELLPRIYWKPNFWSFKIH